MHELLGHEGRISALAISRDGRTIVTRSEDGSVRLWHVPTGQMLGNLEVERMPLGHCCFLTDDAWLAYSVNSDRIRIARVR